MIVLSMRTRGIIYIDYGKTIPSEVYLWVRMGTEEEKQSKKQHTKHKYIF